MLITDRLSNLTSLTEPSLVYFVCVFKSAHCVRVCINVSVCMRKCESDCLLPICGSVWEGCRGSAKVRVVGSGIFEECTLNESTVHRKLQRLTRVYEHPLSCVYHFKKQLKMKINIQVNQLPFLHLSHPAIFAKRHQG